MSRIDPIVMEWLYDSVAGSHERLENKTLRSTVASVTYASRALGRVLITDGAALDVLENLDVRPALPEDPAQLAPWSRRELLRIAARDLQDVDNVDVVGANLAALGDDVLGAALRSQTGTTALAIIGMGKLGGDELNYASDIDVLLVGECEPGIARQVLDVARSCFRIDIALRPEGNAGALVRSLDSYNAYWDKWASPWEFQALLKARPVTGPPKLLEAWDSAVNVALWSRSFGADEIRSVREMKARAESLIEKKGLAAREVKRGRGGIRDVEFAVQLLQLVHGRRDSGIRSKTTLEALRQLASGGYIADSDASVLTNSYRFLRTVEHRLQLVELEQTHSVPSSPVERSRLAKTLNLGLGAFDEALRTNQATVRQAHERLYFRPLLESFSDKELLDPETIEERISALGFTDASRIRTAIRELTRGLTRSSRLMHQMMPLLLDWLSSSPDPDVGLLGLRTLISGFGNPSQIVAAFRDSPEVARRICILLGTSQDFARNLVRDPQLLDDVGRNVGKQESVDTGTWAERLDDALDWRSEPADKQSGLAKFNHVQRTRLAMFDALGLSTDFETSWQRTGLADAILDAALQNLQPQVPVALIAMGRYGGGELGPSSDLDVVVIHGGNGPGDQEKAEVVAQQLLRNVSNPLPAYRLYDLDYDLRPEGRQGTLARSITSVAEYYTKWASTWERQALLRSRFAAGDVEVGHAFFEAIEGFVWSEPPTLTQLREIRHLKARMETERVARYEDPQFHLKLGPGTLSDVEWTVQLLQMTYRIKNTNTLGALRELREKQVITENDATALQNAWVFCQRVRNRLALITIGTANSLPTDPRRLGVLARSLDDKAGNLREEYLRCTRHARLVTERIFYGTNA